MDNRSNDDPKGVWQQQPAEAYRLSPEDLRRKAERLRWETRKDVLASGVLTVALALAPFVLFRLAMRSWHVAGLVAAALWALLVVVVGFRGRLWPGQRSPDPVPASGIDYYQSQLVARRRHLKMAWAWRAPLFLVFGLFAASLVAEAIDAKVQLWNLAPFLTFAAVWVVALLWQTRAQLRRLDEEIRNLDAMR